MKVNETNLKNSITEMTVYCVADALHEGRTKTKTLKLNGQEGPGK